MSQCPYRIKDARKDSTVFHHCRLDDDHKGEHVPFPPAVGKAHSFEGKWHREGDPIEPVEQVPLIPCVPFCQDVQPPPRQLESAAAIGARWLRRASAVEEGGK